MIGELICQTKPPDAGYPPVKLSAVDQATLDKIAKAKTEAPFGRVPGTKTPITMGQYTFAMLKKQKAAQAVDFRWPFWAALGIGALGVVVLAAKR